MQILKKLDKMFIKNTNSMILINLLILLNFACSQKQSNSKLINQYKDQTDTTLILCKSIKEAMLVKNRPIKLFLKSNEIEIFPNEIFEIENLVELNLSSNKLKSLPDNLNKLKSLEKLDISFNGIRSFDNITLPSSLKEIVASFNDLEKFPTNFLNSKLQVIDLFGNPINDISKINEINTTIINLTLSLKNNKILNDNICNLKNLSELSIDNNKLKHLPDCICEMKNMKELRIEETSIDKDEYYRLKECLKNTEIIVSKLIFIDMDSKYNDKKLRNE